MSVLYMSLVLCALIVVVVEPLYRCTNWRVIWFIAMVHGSGSGLGSEKREECFSCDYFFEFSLRGGDWGDYLPP